MVRILILCLLANIMLNGFSQNRLNLNKSIAGKIVEKYPKENISKRPFLNLQNKKSIQKLNPLLYVSGGLLFFYQNLLSEQIQANCVYKNSCSEHAKICIQKYKFKGLLMGVSQFTKCSPAIVQDYPIFLKTDNGKIINELD